MKQPQGGYRIRDPEAIYFITCTVVEWLDVFTRPEYAKIVLDALRYAQKSKGLLIYGWVLMPNHLHLIGQAGYPDKASLSDIIRDFKRHTSKQMVQAVMDHSKESRKGWMTWLFRDNGAKAHSNEVFQFWQYGFHPIELSSDSLFYQRLDYMHDNPIRTGLVWQREHYAYSSAINFAGGKGHLEIEYLKGYSF
ncbi:MAG: transposase [Bacteroidota bacterium]